MNLKALRARELTALDQQIAVLQEARALRVKTVLLRCQHRANDVYPCAADGEPDGPFPALRFCAHCGLVEDEGPNGLFMVLKVAATSPAPLVTRDCALRLVTLHLMAEHQRAMAAKTASFSYLVKHEGRLPTP